MRALALLPLSLSLVAALLVSPAANAADEERPQVQPVAPPAWHVGISGGFAYATASHPELIASFLAPTLGLHAGYNVSERWNVGFEVTTMEKYVAREGGTSARFAPKYPLAGCTNCEAPPPGGYLMSVTTVFGTAGPRFEFSPFGRDGLFVGGAAGVGFIMGIDGRVGGGGTARAGYRARVANVLGLGIEGGVQGQIYKDASLVMPYAALVLRPYF
jgi:hypothetical protein